MRVRRSLSANLPLSSSSRYFLAIDGIGSPWFIRPCEPPPPDSELRSCCNRRVPISQPCPSRPTKFSFGTFTLVKKVSQKGEAPEISLIGRVSTPSASMSISRKLMPACFCVLSVRTSAKHLSAHWPPDVQVFCPLTM